MEDAVAGRGVVRLLHAAACRRTRGRSSVCLSSIGAAGEDEVIVGDRRLARIDRVAAGDLVERVDRERRRAVGRGQQIGVDPQRRPGLELDASSALSTRCAQMICSVVVMPPRRRAGPAQSIDGAVSTDFRNSRRPTAKIPPPRRISSSFGESGTGSYVFPCVTFASCRVTGSNVNSSPSCASATASGLCTTCRPRLKALRRKMSPMLWPQTTTISRPTSSATPFEAGRAHLARRADGEAVAGDHERLAAMDARAEVRHQVAERARLPPLVERLEALRHAVGGRRDLIGVDRVELLRRGTLGSQKISARPLISRSSFDAASSRLWSGTSPRETPGLSRAGWMMCMPSHHSQYTRRRAAADSVETAGRSSTSGTNRTASRDR